MKKLLASLIVLMLMISCCLIAAMPASATDGINYDDWLIYDGSIIEYVGNDANIVIPTVDANGLPVTKIEDNAFGGTFTNHNTTLETVIVSEGITEFGSCVFQCCENLIEVSLPYSLEKVGHSAFLRCSSLTSMTIPGNLKEVSKDFISGTVITDLVISYGVEIIKQASIGGNMTEVIFPSSVYEIDGEAMRYVDTQTGERLEVYITNDDCMLGKNTGDTLIFSEDWGDYGPILRLSRVPDKNWYNSTTKMHIYGLEDGKVKEYVSKYMSDGEQPWYYAVFHEMTEKELDEKNQFCKDNATKKPSADDKDNDIKKSSADEKDNDTDDKDSSSSNKNNNSGSEGMESMMQMMMTFMFGFGSLIVIAVIAVVIIIVLKKSKKKKKKKKAKAEAGIPVEEVPTEEEAFIEETPIEENGEE